MNFENNILVTYDNTDMYFWPYYEVLISKGQVSDYQSPKKLFLIPKPNNNNNEYLRVENAQFKQGTVSVSGVQYIQLLNYDKFEKIEYITNNRLIGLTFGKIVCLSNTLENLSERTISNVKDMVMIA